MPGNEYDFHKWLMGMSDLEINKSQTTETASKIRELEVKVAELEEKEKYWHEERRILLRRIGDDNA